MHTPAIIIVTGPIGSGKTTSCILVAKRAKNIGITVGGIASPRYVVDGHLLGYDALDCSTGETFPLARLEKDVGGSDWRDFGLGYVFSIRGLARANGIMTRVPKGSPSLIILDEMGKLEAGGEGLRRGFDTVLGRLPDGNSLAVISCRLEVADWIREQAEDRSLSCDSWIPGDSEDLWRLVRGE